MRMDEHIKRLIEKYTLEASRLSGNEALERYNMAYMQAKELGNAFTVRACAANLGAMCISLGRKEEAEKGLKYLLEAVPPAGVSDCVSNGDLYFNLGLGYEIAGQFREAQSYLERAWEEYRSERDNLSMEIDTLKKLIQISQTRQKYVEAVRWCLQLEETYAQAQRLVDQMVVMQLRISLQHRLGSEGLAEAVEQCCQRMSAIKEQGLATVGILVHMSVMLTQFSQLNTAREYLEEANGLLGVEHSESLEKAVVLQNLGTLCNYLDDWHTALPYHRQAAAIYHRFASLPPDPASPIQPLAVLRCQGHCMANHAYALVKMEDVDEARVLFNKALELATQSDDLDTKWQMEEALGAVHFRLACHDLNLPSPRNTNLKVRLPASRLKHVEKSLEWYKMALMDLAGAPQGTAAVQDRVLEKCTMVKNFKDNAAVAQAGEIAQLYGLPAHKGAIATEATDGSAAEIMPDKASGEEEESTSGEEDEEEKENEEEEEESDEEKEEDDDDSTHSSSDEEDDKGGAVMENEAGVSTPSVTAFPKKPSLRNRIPVGVTLRTPAEEDEDRRQVNALYEAQLGEEGTLQGNERLQTIKADIHAQHVSSSAESGSTETEEDDSEEEESEEEDDDEVDEGRKLPPVPTQSPPATLQPSGTYEKPKSSEEMQIDELYGATPSRPRPGLHASTNYAELEFDSKQQSGLSKGRGQDPDYEPVEIRQAPPAGRPAQQRSWQEEEPAGFEVGRSCLSHGQSKTEQKDSKTCALM